MHEIKDLGELNAALISNFRLKAQILSILFGTVLVFQICAITYILSATDLIGRVIPQKMVIIGPSLLFVVFILEIIAFRYLKRKQKTETLVKNSFIYLSTFVEVSFPCAIMFIVGNYLKSATLFTPLLIVNSPLLIILFIMIILSSLLLNSRLSLFAGLTAGIQYLLINISFLKCEANASAVDYGNAAIKSILLVVSGLIAGFVSKKIREAIISSLESKNELIYNLDKRVNEKTAEIEKKNALLEEKQKEILDSIHYAKRIQLTLLPAEKYISRVLDELKGKRGK